MIQAFKAGHIGICLFVSLLFTAGNSFAFQQSGTIEKLKETSYQDIFPVRISPPDIKKPIVVAVVDDGLRLSHNDFAGLIYRNEGDNTQNYLDDDGNSKQDDINGWDIADEDPDVNPPVGLENSFFHGTFIAGAAVRTIRLCFGDDIEGLVKILPVKVLSDHSRLPDYSRGYEGIEYAVEQGADIIVCAWSGGTPSPDEVAVVQKAVDQGIIVIGSAGNAYKNSPDPPGSLPGVLTVGGVDSLIRKTSTSNYGSGVDLVAPAWKIKAAYPLADNSYFYGDGTSGAAGMVTGCASVLKILYPDVKSERIIDALVNTAVPVDKVNPQYAGKLGAGMVRLRDAVDYLEDESESEFFLSERMKGKIRINKNIRQAEWEIAPYGGYQGIRLMIEKEKKASRKSMLSFYTTDSLWHSGNLADFPKEIYIPGAYSRIVYKAKGLRKSRAGLSYEAIPVDSSSLYCRDIVHYQLPEGVISDGSEDDNYANNSACKWQIAAPEGSRISLRFEEFATQANVDFLYLFDGESTIPGNMLAKFSGGIIPMNIRSRTNKVLIWFVTDSSITDEGWTLNYTVIEE